MSYKQPKGVLRTLVHIPEQVLVTCVRKYVNTRIGPTRYKTRAF